MGGRKKKPPKEEPEYEDVFGFEKLTILDEVFSRSDIVEIKYRKKRLPFLIAAFFGPASAKEDLEKFQVTTQGNQLLSSVFVEGMDNYFRFKVNFFYQVIPLHHQLHFIMKLYEIII